MRRVTGVIELVRLLILRGEVGPGGRLVELHLADRFGAGRSTIREALRRLEGEGLLVADDAGGMRVVALGAAEVEAALQVRAGLEELSAALAAGAVADGAAAASRLAELERLAAAADDAASGGAPEPAILADRHFHRALAALGANRLCRDTLEHVWDRLVLASAHAVPAARRIAQPGPDHPDLVAAILDGDAGETAGIARRHALAPVA